MQDSARFTNRLATESSPYLLQHAHNPVDWYPWGEEAFARARAEDKPIFLSIGYSACHWCHVMEHESFENPDIARLLNERFISIKVDREERPDVDEIYMTTVQMMTGSGGWPLSVFLMPDARPFYGGTYFPPTSRYNRIGFPSLLTQLADAWVGRREEVEQSAASIVEELQKMAARVHPASADTVAESPDALLDRVVGDMMVRFDAANGGFGGAPKFPPHHSLRLLTLAAQRGDGRALHMLRGTLDRMAIGGIYDQVGGGFHRYATDAIWLVPHFEKMLYDNALLARVYAEAFALTNESAYARIARETCDWMLTDLLDERGGFQAALDADSEGVEGKYYIWTTAEVAALVGPTKADEWAQTFHFGNAGNYHDEATGSATGSNIPHLGAGTPDAALQDEFSPTIDETRAALLTQRHNRIPPGRDDKVITAWNGLTIGALAVCGQRLAEPRYIDAARRAADFCLTTLRGPDNRLLRRFAKGNAGIDAFLDDYAFLCDGLLDLFDVTGESRYLDAVRELFAHVESEFTDSVSGGFFYAAGRSETLIARTKDIFDNALPSANGVLSRVLARLTLLPNGSEFAEAFERQQATYAGLLARAPEAVPTLVEAVLLQSASAILSIENVTPVTLTIVGGTHITLAPAAQSALTFRLVIAPGHHIEANDSLTMPTVATFASDAPAAIGPVTYPTHTTWTDPLGENLSIYQGDITLRLPVVASASARPGSYSLELTVSYQACTESNCLAPAKAAVFVTLTIA